MTADLARRLTGRRERVRQAGGDHIGSARTGPPSGDAIGGTLWGCGVTTLGYFLGQVRFVKSNIELILIGIVVVSVLPIGFELLPPRRSRAPLLAGAERGYGRCRAVAGCAGRPARSARGAPAVPALAGRVRRRRPAPSAGGDGEAPTVVAALVSCHHWTGSGIHRLERYVNAYSSLSRSSDVDRIYVDNPFAALRATPAPLPKDPTPTHRLRFRTGGFPARAGPGSRWDAAVSTSSRRGGTRCRGCRRWSPWSACWSSSWCSTSRR